MRIRERWIFFALTLFSLLGPPVWGEVEIDMGLSRPVRMGRYVGYLQVEGRPERIATQLDLFLRAARDGMERPRLAGILKLSLGGYSSHEYGSQVYDEIRTSHEGNELTFDESSNDLSIALKIGESAGRSFLQGQFWSRTAAVDGSIRLDLAPEEPGEGAEFHRTLEAMTTAEAPFAPLLQGQYTGVCDGKKSVFQVQTVRGLSLRVPDEGMDLFQYEIVARIGNARDPGATSLPWSQIGSFAGGLYDPFRGRLVFSGPSSTSIECFRSGREISCRYRARDFTRKCQFRRDDSDPEERKFYFRESHLRPTAAQLMDLPGNIPELIPVLNGSFSGNLHHEATGKYQPVTMRVIPSVSVNQPRNLRTLHISPTVLTYFGPAENNHFISHRYNPTPFASGAGLILSADGTDSFILVTEWKAGFIRGVWYSNAFGRVGTVELIKNALPILPRDVQSVPGWAGEFEGTRKLSTKEIVRWFQVLAINPGADRTSNMLPFMGHFQSEVRADKTESIVRGRFDPYTYAMGWSFVGKSGLSVISGRAIMDGRLSMHWPPSPGIFPAWMGNLDFYTFKGVSSRR